jgi:hypothetical protein
MLILNNKLQIKSSELKIGLIISGLSFIGCIGYLFFDWRREKGDGWSLKLKVKVKMILRRK